jgi:hypothetical protein
MKIIRKWRKRKQLGRDKEAQEHHKVGTRMLTSGGQKEVRASLPIKTSIHPYSVELRREKGGNKTLERRKIKSSSG